MPETVRTGETDSPPIQPHLALQRGNRTDGNQADDPDRSDYSNDRETLEAAAPVQENFDGRPFTLRILYERIAEQPGKGDNRRELGRQTSS
jgi:hypothetical protein